MIYTAAHESEAGTNVKWVGTIGAVRCCGSSGSSPVLLASVVFSRSLPSRPREFHPEPLTDSGLDTLASSGSCHRPKGCRLPLNKRAPPGEPVGPSPAAMTHPLRSSSITEPSSLLRGGPPLSGASVLSALRLEPLAPFPLASPVRFSRSVPKPGRASRCLHAGCRSVSIRTSSELIPEDGSPPGFDNI